MTIKPGNNIGASVTIERVNVSFPADTPDIAHTLRREISSGNSRFHAWDVHQLLLGLAWDAASQLGDPLDCPPHATPWQRPDTSMTARVRSEWSAIVGALQGIDSDAGNALSHCKVVTAHTDQDGGVLVLSAPTSDLETAARRPGPAATERGGSALPIAVGRVLPLSNNRSWTVSWAES